MRRRLNKLIDSNDSTDKFVLTSVINSLMLVGMEENMELNLGDIIKLKKKHPCGSQEWEILRVGMDFRLKCVGCGHQIMMPRKQVEKNIRGIRSV